MRTFKFHIHFLKFEKKKKNKLLYRSCNVWPVYIRIEIYFENYDFENKIDN